MFGRSANLIIVSAVLGVVAAVSVILRFVARTRWKSELGLEDIAIILGLILTLGICVCIIVGAACFRFGNHEIFITSGPLTGWPEAWLLLGYGKIFYAMQILHCCAMPLIKGSLLLYLNRLFAPSKTLRVGSWIIGGYVFLWWFVTFWMTIFQCWPISYNWGTTPEQMGSCIPDYHAWYAWTALLNVLSDFAVAILPMPIVWSLRLRTERKLAILLFLSTSAVVIVAGIGRTVSYFDYNHKSMDFSYKNYYFLMWTVVEPCLAVVGACIVAMGRLRDVTSVKFYGKLRDMISIRSSSTSSSIPSAASLKVEPKDGNATAVANVTDDHVGPLPWEQNA